MSRAHHDTGVQPVSPTPAADARASELADAPTSELAGDLARQVTSLVHNEIELAKAELAQKGRRAGLGAGAMGAAAVFGFLGLGCLLAAAIAGLHLVVAVWVSALVVGGACLVVGGVSVLAGRHEVRQATPPVPTEAIESTKEDVRWLKTQATSARR